MSDFDYFAHDHRSHFERMLAGLPYVANAEHEAANRQAMELTAQYERNYLENPERAQQTLQRLCGELGPEVTVRPPLRVDYGVNLHLGERTFINYGLTALDVARISIGANCQIGPNVQLLTPTHALEPIPRAAGVESAAPITIGRNVWLGGGVIVGPGVSIGDNSIIGAGAVVIRDIPSNCVAVGNPARVVRELDPNADPYREQLDG